MVRRMATSAAARERAEHARQDRERAFELNPIQYEFVYDDEHKWTAYIGGLGAGKSFAGGVKALRYAVEHPGSLGVIGAPNYPQLRDSTMRSFLGDILPPGLKRSYNKTDGILTLKNGSEILFRSMDDPDNRRGPNLAWFWLDEGPLCGYYAWKVMKGRLRQAGFVDEVQGWVTGTPHGEDEYYEDFENYQQSGRPRDGSHKLYRASTRENLHNLPDTYIEDLGYDGEFALQEVEGLFVSFRGLVYRLMPEWHTGEWDFTNAAHRPALRIGGVDWGYTNPAVALPIWVDGDDRAWVLDEFYQRQVGLAGVKRAACKFSTRYGITHWYCGPDEPEHIAELNAEFARQHINARALAANDEINAGIETVRRQLKLRPDGTSGFKLSARCVNTRAEFRTYCYPTKDTGRRDPQEKPVKHFDHSMDACRYALHTTLGGRTRHQSLPMDVVREQARNARRISDIGGISIRKRQF